MLRALILLVAIAAGGAAAWVSMAMTASPHLPVAAAPAPVQNAEVLVAAGPLVPGSVLKPEDMRWQSWPEDVLVDGFIVRASQPDAPEGFAGRMTRIELFAGEPIRAERLVLSRGGFLSVQLETGKRAIAVRVSAESTAGGFIMPNDRVDVLRTISSPGPQGQVQMVSEAILRNVRVLAIDQSTDNHAGETVLGKTATLELEGSEVEIVLAGEASGQLSLSLRAFADNDEAPQIATPTEPQTIVRIRRAGVPEQVELR